MEVNLVVVRKGDKIAECFMFMEEPGVWTAEQVSEAATEKFLNLCEKHFPKEFVDRAVEMLDNLTETQGDTTVSLVVPDIINKDDC